MVKRIRISGKPSTMPHLAQIEHWYQTLDESPEGSAVAARNGLARWTDDHYNDRLVKTTFQLTCQAYSFHARTPVWYHACILD